jgi:hypothetical protein
LTHLVHPLVPGDGIVDTLVTLGCAMICLALAFAADIYFDRPLQIWLKRTSRARVIVA